MNWSGLLGRETGKEEEGLIKKHCFEWIAVNRRMEFKQLKDKQARGLCIHSCTHSGVWGIEAIILEAIYAAFMLEMRKHMGGRCLVWTEFTAVLLLPRQEVLQELLSSPSCNSSASHCRKNQLGLGLPLKWPNLHGSPKRIRFLISVCQRQSDEWVRWVSPLALLYIVLHQGIYNISWVSINGERKMVGGKHDELLLMLQGLWGWQSECWWGKCWTCYGANPADSRRSLCFTYVQLKLPEFEDYELCEWLVFSYSGPILPLFKPTDASTEEWPSGKEEVWQPPSTTWR